MKFLSPAIVLIALALALAMRPWRLLGQAALVSPLLASLVITPWLWALPWLQHRPLQLQLSGACLIGLALGWPSGHVVNAYNPGRADVAEMLIPEKRG